jgi:putative NIF3 family GTP cyclohydrolase 1 type 2
MNAFVLYEKLENDFINPQLFDEWAMYMNDVQDYLCDNFRKRSMGLVCDFTKEVNKVYTAVFPTKEVMQKIVDDGAKNAMLFVHHPSIWDIRKAPSVFYQMPINLLDSFKNNRISIYNLHVPLDNFNEYSTSKTLAEALGIEIEKTFAKYYGSLCGVIGKTKHKDICDLQKQFSELLGHDTKLYLYGDRDIRDGRVAIIAGGGNNKDFVMEIKDNNVCTLITGITCKNSHSEAVHEFEQESKISIIGGTHYSTEKFSCIAMCRYFEKLGLSSEFIEGEPILEDM